MVTTREELMKKLSENPGFRMLPTSGAGFVIPGARPSLPVKVTFDPRHGYVAVAEGGPVLTALLNSSATGPTRARG
jgi:hypothetical protein